MLSQMCTQFSVWWKENQFELSVQELFGYIHCLSELIYMERHEFIISTLYTFWCISLWHWISHTCKLLIWLWHVCVFFVSLLLKKRKKSHVAMTLHMLSLVELWQQVGKYVSFCGKYVKWKELSYRSKCKNIHSKWKNLYKYMCFVFLITVSLLLWVVLMTMPEKD